MQQSPVLDPAHLPLVPLPDLLAASVAACGSRTAIVDGPSGRSVDYTELDRRVERIAAWLAADGVGRGDRIATWAPNVPPAAAVCMAAWRLGAVVVPLSPAWTVEEARALTAVARVTHVLAVPGLVDAAQQLEVDRVVSLAPDDRVTDLDELLACSAPAPPHSAGPQLDDLAVLSASSGTTGLPKLVQLTHRNLAHVTRDVIDAFAVTADDVTVAVAPWFHILGLTAELLVPLTAGATVVAMPAFEPNAFLDLLERHRVTYLAVPPLIASFLASVPGLEDRDLSALEVIGVGGAALPPDVQARVEARLPHVKVGQGWGLTETAGAICIPSRATGTPPGTVGKPLPFAELKVVDPETLEDLPTGAEGELLVRGPHLMAGYLGDAASDDSIWAPDGWLRTGDLGHVDADGNVVLSGRIKELIKVNGLQVSPSEVEQALMAHPSVRDAAVVGRPHERTGETPVAFVVVAPGTDLDVIAEDVATRLASYKRPTRIDAVDELPRTPSGKLLRRLLPD